MSARGSVANREAAVRKVISVLEDPDVSPFLDRDGFAAAVHVQALLNGLAHAVNDGGATSSAEALLVALRKTGAYESSLKIFARTAPRWNPGREVLRADMERLGLRKAMPGGTVALKPGSKVGFRAAKAILRKAAENKLRSSPAKRKKLKKVDMLDSFERLPGSFGSGRRR